jgi:hypothetical protein
MENNKLSFTHDLVNKFEVNLELNLRKKNYSRPTPLFKRPTGLWFDEVEIMIKYWSKRLIGLFSGLSSDISRWTI